LFYALDAINSALLTDVEAHYKSPETKPYPDDSENPLLSELSKYLEAVGINDPMTKIYITTQPLPYFPLFMLFFLLVQAPKFRYDKHLAILNPVTPRKKGGIDSTPFILGYITMLKQFHSIHTQKLLSYIGQYVRAHVNLIPK
jgi:WASH complex subunit strumpellin